MGKSAAMTTLDELKEWFFLQDCPKWNLHKGDPQKRIYLHQQSQDDMSLEESWDLLARCLEPYLGSGDGVFTIFCPTISQNRGTRAYFSTEGPASSYRGRAGIGGIPPYIGSDIDSYVQQRVNEAVERERLRKEIEDLKEAQIGQTSFMERLVEDNFDTIVQTLGPAISKILIKPKPAQVSMNGFDQSEQQPPQNQDGATDEQLEVAQRIQNALGRLARVFPDIPTFLEGLADFADQQPALAQQLFNSKIMKDE
jgi:hypothetical protein